MKDDDQEAQEGKSQESSMTPASPGTSEEGQLSTLHNFSNGDLRSLHELGQDYNGLMEAIETELCAVEGLDGLQAQARTGRSTGARFCWTPAIGDDTAGAAKTTSVSRAWRRTAKWLGDVTNTARQDRAEMARWKIRFYRHPKPNPAQVSTEQTMSFKMFDDWRSCIKAGQLHSNVWVGMLRQVAERQADREESAAQLASIKDYVLWVSSGPAGGLKRQHQFTRIATGWVETSLNMLNGNELGDMDDLDGLSRHRGNDVARFVGIAIGQVFRTRYDADHVYRQVQFDAGRDRAEHAGATAHVIFHFIHTGRRFDGDAAGIEGQAFADQDDWCLFTVTAAMFQHDQPGFLATSS